MTRLLVIDVESDGPCPVLYSMVSFGAVIVDRALDKTFYGQVAPISMNYIPEALNISGISRSEHESFPSPEKTMKAFLDWLAANQGPFTFISDNPAFDWQWINYYMHKYVHKNPLGFSGRRIGDIYAGYKNSLKSKYNTEWKKLYRKTEHDHNPVNDAKGNAEALIAFSDELLIGGILDDKY